VLVDSQIVDAAAENSNAKIGPQVWWVGSLSSNFCAYMPILSMHHAGRGSLNFTVTEFDDYYVAFGNLNVHEMKV